MDFKWLWQLLKFWRIYNREIHVVTEIVKTCEECPAQWEAKLKSGRYLYIRFMHGYLSVRIGDSETNAVSGEEILYYGQNEIDGGEMTFEELKNICCKKIIFDCNDLNFKKEASK